MSKYRYGVKALKVSDIDPETGLPLAGTTKEIQEDIYRDSFDLVEEEGTTTDHYSEMNPDPEITFEETGKTMANLQLMDTSVETVALFKGGEVVTDAGSGTKTWSKPASQVNIEKYIELEHQDGYKTIIPRAKVTGVLNMQIRRNGIGLLNLKFTAQRPKVAGLNTIDIVEPGAGA